MANPEVSTAFNGNAEQFAVYAETVRGYVRYQVTQRNLAEIVNNGQIKVADIGGGSGIDSLWLAELGHEVTLIEPAQDQVGLARRRIAQSAPEVRQRITIIEATPEAVAPVRGDFDLVLSHGVTMYMEKPQAFILLLATFLKPGGHISLLEKGFYGKQAQLVTNQDWMGLASLRENPTAINRMGLMAKSFLPGELKNLLERAQIKPINWSGIRIFTNTMDQPISDFTPDQLRAIVDAEYEQGHNEHLRYAGQMFHFIGRKPVET